VATDLSEQGWVYGPYIDTDESINTGVVKRNTNLRQGPSSSQPIVRMLQADEPFSLVNIVKSNNYYHVKTAQSEDGWAYAPNITITNTTPPPPPTTDPTPFIDAHEGPYAWMDRAGLQTESGLSGHSSVSRCAALEEF
jgi:hypothetical protein